ncbi:Rv1733c family protein [Streptomyces malaysiensis]|uniref:Rv1733c family protein n=1 Tax=Streptomyces malaysiensis TaxID=92644 RepID=UPI0033D6403B
MGGGRPATKRLWRWRDNPLRRRDDILEAWIMLAVWAVIAVGGTVIGLVTAHAADEVFARQRAERHSVRAVLLDDVPRNVTGDGAAGDRITARVRWTGPEGSTHTDETLVESGLKAGTRTVIWTDGRDEITVEPLTPMEASIEAGALATVAALAFAGIAFGAGTLARWRLDRRRIDRWGTDWDLVGPRWGHRTG